jgi:MFS family permease
MTATHGPARFMTDQVSSVWDSPRELGSVQSITAVGGTPISVLAGFSLTSAIMVSGAAGGVWRDVAVVLFAVAAAAFILALEAVSYAASPDIRLAYRPEARISEEVLQEERRLQYEDEWLLDIYNQRIVWSTTVGVAGSLGGLGAALLTARVTWGVVIGVVVLVLVTGVVLLNQLNRAGRLFPRPHHVPAERRSPPPLDDLGRAALLSGTTPLRADQSPGNPPSPDPPTTSPPSA